MFETIILALDGSHRSDVAVDAVTDLAGPGSHVVAVHVKTHATEHDQDALITEQLERLRAAGMQVELERGTTVMGDEANVIARAGRRHDASVIVAATRGHTPLSGLLVGSVTQRLLHLADCPVLVIPPADEIVAEITTERTAEVAR
jgi:nucleotide-binding universal stress UspA family protein